MSYELTDAHRGPEQCQEQSLISTEDRMREMAQWESHDEQHAAPAGQQPGSNNDHAEKHRADEQHPRAGKADGEERWVSLHHADHRHDSNDRVPGDGQHRSGNPQSAVPRRSAVQRMNAEYGNDHCDVGSEYDAEV